MKNQILDSLLGSVWAFLRSLCPHGDSRRRVRRKRYIMVPSLLAMVSLAMAQTLLAQTKATAPVTLSGPAAATKLVITSRDLLPLI
jgi:hypothetical protein